MRHVGPAILAFFLCACSGDGDLSLIVELRTDYVAGVEFAAVRTSLEDRSVSDEVAALRGEDFADRRRVAGFDGLPNGTRSIQVSLLDAGGRVVASRRVLRAQDDNASVLVVVARACEGLVCPSPGDDVGRTECRGGTCVSPSCDDATGDGCEAACTTASDCGGGADCGTVLCEEGACLSRGDDTLCAGGEYCDPVRGCRAVGGPPPDVGLDAGPEDTGPSDTGAPDAPDTGVTDAGGGCGVDELALGLFRASSVPPGLVMSLPDLAPLPPALPMAPVGGTNIVADGTTLTFDGTAAIESPLVQSEQLRGTIISAGEATLEAWVVAGTRTWRETIFKLGDGLRFERSGPASVEFRVGGADMVIAGVLDDTAPHHLVGTYDGTAAGHRFFIDGVEVTSAGDGSTMGFSDWTAMWPFLKIGNGDGAFTGQVYLAAIWDRVLTPTQIDCLFAAGPRR